MICSYRSASRVPWRSYLYASVQFMVSVAVRAVSGVQSSVCTAGQTPRSLSLSLHPLNRCVSFRLVKLNLFCGGVVVCKERVFLEPVHLL